MNFLASFLAQGSLWSGFTDNQGPKPTEWRESILQTAVNSSPSPSPYLETPT